MDVVLELLDTYFFDRVYATILPRHSGPSFDPVSTLTNGWMGFEGNSSAWSGMGGGEVTRSQWQYKPASTWLSFSPSDYAWQSRWDRDDVVRQAVSLYLITW
jgi:Delta7-sterol 5-desaturase